MFPNKFLCTNQLLIPVETIKDIKYWFMSEDTHITTLVSRINGNLHPHCWLVSAFWVIYSKLSFVTNSVKIIGIGETTALFIYLFTYLSGSQISRKPCSYEISLQLLTQMPSQNSNFTWYLWIYQESIKKCSQRRVVILLSLG